MKLPNVELIYADFTRRGGKTDCAVTYCCSEAIKSKQDIRYSCAFQSDLVEFIKPAFDTVLSDCPDDLKPTYLESKREYQWANGSRVKLVGLDLKPNGVRGNAVTIIVIDEAAFVQKLAYIWESVIIPATARRKGQMQRKIKFIIITSPPREATEHFTHKLKTRAQTEANGFYLCRTLDEVKSIDDTEKTRLLNEVGGRTSITAQREFFCKWIVDADQALCANFDPTKHVDSFELPAYSVPTFAGDIGGVKDKTVGLIGAWCPTRQKILVRSEAAFDPNTPSDVILEGFKAIVAGRKMNQFIDPPGGHQILIDFNRAGFKAAPCPRDEFHAGLSMIRNAFYQDRILIHPDCHLLIKTLSGGLLNNRKDGYASTPSLGHCDAAAALTYLYRLIDRETDLSPAPSKFTHQYHQPTKPNKLTGLAWDDY